VHRRSLRISTALGPFIPLAILFCIHVPAVGLPQQTPPEPASPSAARDSVYRFEGGTTSLREVEGERVLEGRERVRITHGNVTITADRGVHYERKRQSHLFSNVQIDQEQLHMQGDEGEYFGFEDRAVLRGRVKMRDRGIHAECDEAIFFRKTEKAWLLGNVVVVDSSTTLETDSLYYDKRLSVSEAFGNVRITDAKEQIRVRGEHGYYFQKEGKGVIDVLPHLVVDPESDEPTKVDSDTLVFFPDKRVAKARGRVKIIKGNTVTQCDSAVVYDNSRTAELYGKPLAKQGRVSMQGDQMAMRYDQHRIRSIRILGQAMIKETPEDSLVVARDSWIQGDSMTLYLRENALDSIRVEGRAESEYYPESATRVEGNYAKGDSMFFLFKDDSLSYVKIVGEASGVYRYIKLNPGETGDSLKAQRDTSLTYVSFAQKAGRVDYAGETIEYYARRRDLILSKNAKVEYQGKTLLGKHITYSANLELLDAQGSPVLIEGADKLYGRQMDYDLETGTGLVEEGTTKFMDGYYNGRTIAKVGNDILKVWNSTYTTCDLRTPHYHITSNRMKVYLDDKVVTGPLVLYIGETPLAVLPFFAQNIRRGRRSGILRPVFEFGITSQKDRFIRNVGYYWATNQYTDFTFIGDFNENRSFRLNVQNRYKLRYSFEGGVNFSFYRDLANYLNQWILTGDHSQTLGEKTSFAAQIHFVSSDQATKDVNYIDQVQDVVDRRIESTASLRKSWSSVGFSASGRRTQILDVSNPATVRVSMELPNVSLSIPSRTLYFGKKSKQGYESVLEKVLGGIRVSPGLSGSRKTEERLYDRTETITTNGSLGVSAPFKLSFVSLSPQFSVSDRYQRVSQDVFRTVIIDTTQIPPDTTIVRPVHLSENQVTMSTGVSANTNLYGTVYTRIGVLRGIRHTLTPSASYSYIPAIQGRPSSSSMSFSLRNAIDLKVARAEEHAGGTEVGEGEDSTMAERGGGGGPAGEEKVNKLSGVFIWTLNTTLGQDSRTREYKWSRISSLANLRVVGTNISLSQTIDPYEWKVLNTSLSSSVGFHGTHPFGRAAEAAAPELNVAAGDTAGAGSGAGRDYGPTKGAKEEEGLPWDLSLAFSYSRSAGFDKSSSTLNLGGSVSITRGWKLEYRTTYNVIDRDLLGDYYAITRDLHCWEMSFSRQKLGDEWEFYFRINIKAHPEIYAEQGSRGLGTGSITSPLGY
jgi:lipopolysaccharide assembly outer membrane protein LptD (OstA)